MFIERKGVKNMAEKTLNQEARGFLADVPEEYLFRCCDGHTLLNMKELGDSLKIMKHETYVSHANVERNDFTNWVRDIIKDGILAKDLKKATNQAQADKLVANRIAVLIKRSLA